MGITGLSLENRTTARIRTLGAIAITFLFLANIGSSQTSDPKPTEAEIRKAHELATQLINDYQETRSIKPLIQKYFVSDFARRLRFCWTSRSDDCGGFARDFWKGCNEDFCDRLSERDLLRYYSDATDFQLLYWQISLYVVSQSGKTVDSLSEKEGEQLERQLQDKIKKELKSRPELIKLSFLESGLELWWAKRRSPKQFRRMLIDMESYISALRRVESKLRYQLTKNRPTTDLRVAPLAFRVDVEINKKRFFDFDEGARMIDVWPDKMEQFPLIFDMIHTDQGLKIVAMYPPID